MCISLDRVCKLFKSIITPNLSRYGCETKDSDWDFRIVTTEEYKGCALC